MINHAQLVAYLVEDLEMISHAQLVGDLETVCHAQLVEDLHRLEKMSGNDNVVASISCWESVKGNLSIRLNI